MINMMKLNKSTGLDGSTVEFYQTFWDKIKFFLVDVLNKSQDEKLLTYSQRTSVLSLILRKDDPLILENYRPISLLNVDLKLYLIDQNRIVCTFLSATAAGFTSGILIVFASCKY
jgi:hypothetical protein